MFLNKNNYASLALQITSWCCSITAGRWLLWRNAILGSLMFWIFCLVQSFRLPKMTYVYATRTLSLLGAMHYAIALYQKASHGRPEKNFQAGAIYSCPSDYGSAAQLSELEWLVSKIYYQAILQTIIECLILTR